MSGFVFIPEEIVALSQFLVLTMGRINGFESIGVVACIEHFGGYRHGRRREVLYLFKFVTHLARQTGQFCHITLMATWVAGDEVGDDLLVESLLAIDAVEDTLELVELLERRLAHQSEHMVGSMLWSHLQTSADMILDEFTGVLHSGLVGLFVLAAIQQQVVAHTTANETLLDAWQRVDGTIDFKQF